MKRLIHLWYLLINHKGSNSYILPISRTKMLKHVRYEDGNEKSEQKNHGRGKRSCPPHLLPTLSSLQLNYKSVLNEAKYYNLFPFLYYDFGLSKILNRSI